MRSELDSKLLDIVACPVCKGPLQVTTSKDRLVCRAERLAFPIRDGIPVLLEDDAQSLSSDALDALLKSPSR